jgi:hypothetical protein
VKSNYNERKQNPAGMAAILRRSGEHVKAEVVAG